MRKNLVLPLIGALIVVGGLGLVSSTSEASTTRVDLSITGHTVAGFTAAQQDQELPVMFTMKNHGTNSTQVAFTFTITNGSADGSDYVCPLISSHLNINPDSPSCEIGALGVGRSTSAAILVTPTITQGTVTVKACASSLDDYFDPTPGNNCKTVSIPIE